MKTLHPGAKWKFRIEGYFIALFLIMFFCLPFFMMVSSGEFSWNVFLIMTGGITIFLIILIEILTHFTYINWKYEFAKDSLKIEKGIIVKRYKSIPYTRVQNLDITRGIVARICGFSTMDIQTAGYSGPYGNGGRASFSEGRIPAVSIKEAEKIRDFLIAKISKKKTPGL